MKQTLGEKIKDYCLSIGISVSEFEKRCGLSKGFVIKKCKQGVETTPRMLKNIKDTFPDLFSEEGVIAKRDINRNENELIKLRNENNRLVEVNEQLKDCIEALKTAIRSNESIIEQQKIIINNFVEHNNRF